MNTRALAGQLNSARTQLDLASTLLARPSPEALESCSGVLEEAGRQLAQYEPVLAHFAGDAALRQQARLLRRSYERAARLLQGAADFHLGWLQIRGAMSGGYTKTGESAPLIPRPLISIQG